MGYPDFTTLCVKNWTLYLYLKVSLYLFRLMGSALADSNDDTMFILRDVLLEFLLVIRYDGSE